MDEIEHHAPTGTDPAAAPAAGPDAASDVVAAAPDPAAVQVRLPFDLDEPIPYRLTARARRAVAPDSLPPLEVVAPSSPAGSEKRAAGTPPLSSAVDTGDLDDPNDTRRARARALRRAGLELADIAVELGVDDLVVRAWAGDVTPVRSARRRLRAVASTGSQAATASVDQLAAQARARAAFAETREHARGAAIELARDPDFLRGLGLLSGVADVDLHAIVLTVRDAALASGLVGWLRRHVGPDPARVRVILRLAPQLAADRAVHDWAAALEVDPARVAHTRWRDAPDADAVEAMIRIADPMVAGTVAGWRDHLLGTLGSSDDPGER